MNTQELAAKLANEHGITKKLALDLVKSMAATIESEVRAGNTVAMHGFGTFKPKIRPARTGRNPLTGASIEIPTKTSMQFACVPALRDL